MEGGRVKERGGSERKKNSEPIYLKKSKNLNNKNILFKKMQLVIRKQEKRTR